MCIRDRSNRSDPKRIRKGGRNPDFMRSKDENSRHFKGKRKSERWKKTEKRKTKFSPFADNYIEKDFSVDNLDSVKNEPLSRRKRQKKNFASLDTNFKHKKKSGTLKIKKTQETNNKTSVNKRAKKKEN